jgi:hypothetical protein
MTLKPETFLLNPKHEDFATGRGPLPSQHWGLVWAVAITFSVLMIGSMTYAAFVLLQPSPDLPPSEQWTLNMMRFAPAVLALINGAGLVVLRKKQCRDHRFRAEGRLLEGQVVTCSATQSSESGYLVELSYSFLTPDGRTLEGKGSERREDLKGTPLPMPGTPVSVLYVDNKLHKVL